MREASNEINESIFSDSLLICIAWKALKVWTIQHNQFIIQTTKGNNTQSKGGRHQEIYVVRVKYRYYVEPRREAAWQG